jgi:hypothetical protein
LLWGFRDVWKDFVLGLFIPAMLSSKKGPKVYVVV